MSARRLLEKIRRLRFRSLYRGDYADESERSVENTDAATAAGARNLGAAGGVAGPQYPPGYVKTYDEDRPRPEPGAGSSL